MSTKRVPCNSSLFSAAPAFHGTQRRPAWDTMRHGHTQFSQVGERHTSGSPETAGALTFGPSGKNKTAGTRPRDSVWNITRSHFLWSGSERRGGGASDKKVLAFPKQYIFDTPDFRRLHFGDKGKVALL